jgi:hypothetical protein
MKLSLLAFLAALAFALPASATTVSFNTTSSQLCVGASGCGTNTQTVGGSVVVTFNGVSSSVNPNPTTFSSFGNVVVSCVGGGTACGDQSLAGLNLYLNIAQTLPSMGNASLPGGVISGVISGNASSAFITWSVPNDRYIGAVQYSLFNSLLSLSPPSNSGITTVQGVITIPEPSTYAMLLGAAGLFFLRRRSR